jgi:hypothetical protein
LAVNKTPGLPAGRQAEDPGATLNLRHLTRLRDGWVNVLRIGDRLEPETAEANGEAEHDRNVKSSQAENLLAGSAIQAIIVTELGWGV